MNVGIWVIAAIGLYVLIFFVGFPLMTLIIITREKKFVWELERQETLAETELQAVQTFSSAMQSNPYAPPVVASEVLPLTPAGQAICNELFQQGYQYLDNYRHAKRGIYRIRWDAWISPDRTILATVSSGSLMAIPIQNLRMTSFGISRRSAGHSTSNSNQGCLVSITNEKSFDACTCGMIETMLFTNANAAELDRLHRQRLQLVDPVSYGDDPIGELREFSEFSARTTCELGNGRFITAEQDVWLPTMKGVFLVFFQMYGFMLGRRIYSDRRRLQRRLKSLVTVQK